MKSKSPRRFVEHNLKRDGAARDLSKGAQYLGDLVMLAWNRITFDPNVMGGRACIRGMRITVALVVNLVAGGMSVDEILEAYPYLEQEDIAQALQYAAFE